MNLSNPSKRLCVSLLVLSLGAAAAKAGSLLLDFGPIAVASGVATLSPAHAAGVVPAEEVSWNTSLTADSASLVYGDGTAASGVSLVLGRSAAGVSTVDFSDKGYSSSALGGSINTGIYTTGSPVRDALFGGSGSGNAYALGLRIDGMPAGDYVIYAAGRNTSTANASPERFYAQVGPSAGTYSFSAATDVTALQANSSPAITTNFVAGDNYTVLAVTVGAGQSLFLAVVGTTGTELRGFLNSVEIVPGGTGAKVLAQPSPATQTVLEGMFAATISAGLSGTQPLRPQWRHNEIDVQGATNATLTLSNISLEMAGNYSLFVTNNYGSDLSSNAVLNVTPVANTGELTPLWTLLPGDRDYLTSSSTNAERGVAFNPANSNLLMACRAPTNAIYVLDPATGAEKHVMDVTGIPGGVPNVGVGMSLIGVAEDGAVYVGSVTANAGTGAYVLYRWDDDSATAAPLTVFSGDPAWMVQPGLRWGDTLAVRGAGASTQILLAPSSGTNVVLLRTSSGHDFQNEIPPTVIAVDVGVSGFALSGIAFGPGTNTFWAKAVNNQLRLIQFDLDAGTGTVLYAWPGTAVPGSVGPIGASSELNLLAGLSFENPDNVRLYSVSDLVAGPMLVDQELFTVKNPNFTQGGTGSAAFGGNWLFVLDSNNGIKAFTINTNAVIPANITVQPANQTVTEGIAGVTFSAGFQGSPPVSAQWRFNGGDMAGETNSTLTLSNVTAGMAGPYSLFVSNAYGTDLSSNAVLTVLPGYNTAQMTNIWNLVPGDRAYLGTDYTERGIAFNSATSNLLLVSRSPSASIVVLDPETGAEKRFMNVDGVIGDVPGASLGLSTAGVAEDGVVFGGSVSVNSYNNPYYLYRWADDSESATLSYAFAGDPAGAIQPGLRFGDNLAVRGSGASTQVLLAPGSGTNVVLLQTADGSDFQYGVAPAVIAVSGVPSGFAQLGVAFGPGTNTFWGKTASGQLYLIGFDLASSTGAVLQAYGTNSVAAALRGISTDPAQKFLAGVTLDSPDSAQLYDIANLAVGPLLRDQELFTTRNPNTTQGGFASTAFGGNYLFALDSNNGLKAFLIDTNYSPALAPFQLSVTPQSGAVVLAWETVAGHTYQVQSKTALQDSWADFGSVISATGTNASVTIPISDPVRFYRVQGQ